MIIVKIFLIFYKHNKEEYFIIFVLKVYDVDKRIYVNLVIY